MAADCALDGSADTFLCHDAEDNPMSSLWLFMGMHSRFQPATNTCKKTRLGESLPCRRQFGSGLLAAAREPEDQQAWGRRSLAPDAGECKISVP